MPDRAEGPATPEVFVVAGRRFRSAGRHLSFAADTWLGPHLKASGLYDYLVGRRRPEDGQDPAAFFEQLVFDVAESGHAHHLLAGMTVEEGVEWTEEWAEDFRLFCRRVTVHADRQTLTRMATEVLLDFLQSGLKWLLTLPTASARQPAALSEAESSSAGSPPRSAASAPSAPSPPSSDALPTAIPSASTP